VIRINPWLDVGFAIWFLAFEASTVIALRTARIASGGPAAVAETQRMVSEKVKAGAALQALAMTGALGVSAPTATAKTLSHYRRKVRANRRRLSKP